MLLLALLSGCLYDRQRFLELSEGFVDDDGDGYREVDRDCDDANAKVNPGVVEVCDGIDNDCNEGADELDAADIRVWYQDRDQDGYGNNAVSKLSCVDPYLFSAEGGDCDDENPDFHPEAVEICEAGVDSNCDGQTVQDADGDGHRCDDCNNTDAAVYPGAPETCNGIDDDCDARIDNDPVDAPIWYWDQDGDGYGDPERPLAACEKPTTYVVENTDCDDSTADAAPGLSELCNDGLDTNCDGVPGECGAYGELLPMATLTGLEETGFLAMNLSSLGDINEDGYDDLVVAAPYAQVKVHTVGGPYSGEVPVNLVSGLQLEGEDTLGYSLANAGDQTGDGRNDILVSSCDGDYAGDVYVIDSYLFGRFQQEDVQLAHVPGTEPEACTGARLGAFDVNQDAQDDVAILAAGSPWEISLIAGPLAGEYDRRTDAYALLTGEQPEDTFGGNIVVSDIDGNGQPDVVATAVNYESEGSYPGRAYLFLDVRGGTLASADADRAWWGEGDSFVGTSLSLGEDQSGDGHPDLWVGAYDGLAGPNTGSVRRVSSEAPSGLLADHSELTILTADRCCNTVVEDLNRDGTQDLVISDGEWTGGTYGKVHLFYGPLAGTMNTAAADAWYAGPNSLGDSLDFAGDTDGDGNLEVVAGARSEDEWTGAVYLLEVEVW